MAAAVAPPTEPNDWVTVGGSDTATPAEPNDWVTVDSNHPAAQAAAAPSSSGSGSLLDYLGGWKGIGAAGIRGAAGILGSEGGWPGAAINAAGETGAEMLEQGTFNPLNADPTRVGTEAAFGAIPFGKIVRGGKYLASALKSGALGAAHAGTSEAIQSYKDIGNPFSEMNAGDIGISGGVGALGGLLGARLGRPSAGGGSPQVGGPSGPSGAPPAGPIMNTPPVITQEAGNRVFRVPGSEPATVLPQAAAKVTPPLANPADQSGFANTLQSSLGKLLSKQVPSGSDLVKDLDQNIAGVNKNAAATRAANFRYDTAAGRSENSADIQQLTAQMRAQNLARAAAEKEAANQAALDKITAAREAAGVVANPPNFGESLSAKTPDNTSVSMRTSFSLPETEEGVEGAAGATKGGIDPLDSNPTTVVGDPAKGTEQEFESTVPPEANITPEPENVSQEPSPLAKALGVKSKPNPSNGPKQVKQSPVQKFNSGVDSILNQVSPPEPNIGAEPAVETSAPNPISQSVEPPAEADQSPVAQLARLFKSKADAAGVNYGAAKTDPNVNPLGLRAAAIAAGKEATDAGIGSRPQAPGTLGKYLNSRVSPEISAGLEAAPAAPASTPNLEGSGSPLAAPTAAPTAAGSPADFDPSASVADTGIKGTLDPNQKASLLDWLTKQLGPEGSGGQRGSVVLPSISDATRQALRQGVVKAAGTGAGALGGGILGGSLDEDDPDRGALGGALAGGILGYAGTSGAQMEGPGSAGMKALKNLVAWRNAGLLSGIAQVKKPLSDVGAMVGMAGERALSGDVKGGGDLLKELFRVPTNVKNYAQALKNPDAARLAIGDLSTSATPNSSEALGLVARPFGAAQYATQLAMERAGVPRDKAVDALMLGDPKTFLGKLRMKAQQSPVAQVVAPFARIATNLAEGGLQRIPGVGYIPSLDKALGGDPETKFARSVLGSLSMAAGAGTGYLDSQAEENGEDPTSPAIRGLRRAALARYGLPYALGESLTGPHGIRDAYYMLPGTSSTLPAPGPKDNLWDYLKKYGKRTLDQMLPDWANPTATSDDSANPGPLF